jgi:hypothetical protein
LQHLKRKHSSDVSYQAVKETQKLMDAAKEKFTAKGQNLGDPIDKEMNDENCM